MRIFKTDLHIHTCLSPCAELEMSPRAIVRQAKLKGLDIIGIAETITLLDTTMIQAESGNLPAIIRFIYEHLRGDF
ncbi:MAG: PHP domain-containing protein [Candidatus Desantisbacteria bacterium]